MKDHIVKTDDNEYEITFHPAFASRCTVSGKDGERELFRQKGVYQLRGRPVPKQHTIRIRAKNGSKRDITIRLDDAAHSVARITVELYEEGHDPMTAVTASSTDTVFTVENSAKICTPICDD